MLLQAAALFKGLGMAGYPGNILDSSAFNAKEIMGHRKIQNLVDEQASAENKIHNLTNLAGPAVFQRKNRTVHFS